MADSHLLNRPDDWCQTQRKLLISEAHLHRIRCFASRFVSSNRSRIRTLLEQKTLEYFYLFFSCIDFSTVCQSWHVCHVTNTQDSVRRDGCWMHVGESVTEVKEESAKQHRFIYAAFIIIKTIHFLLLRYFKQMNQHLIKEDHVKLCHK